jgi:hypothetical protein
VTLLVNYLLLLICFILLGHKRRVGLFCQSFDLPLLTTPAFLHHRFVGSPPPAGYGLTREHTLVLRKSDLYSHWSLSS